MENSIALLIPTYNCEKTIEELVKESKKYISNILVVSDGSKDETVEKALRAGAEVLVLKKNNGKGYAIKEGLKVLLSQPLRGILFMDGDGQHNPKEIPKFIKAFENYDFVIGERNLKKENSPSYRRIANYLGGLFLEKMTGYKLKDWQCGFRLISKNFLKKMKISFERYEFESQMLIFASKNKIKLGFVDIDVIYNGDKSHYKKFKDTFLICLKSLELFYER